jgi:hypothetical protein
VVVLLVTAGQPITVAIDDTLLKRRGKRMWAASWFHDGSAPGPAKTGYGNNWVVAGMVVKAEDRCDVGRDGGNSLGRMQGGEAGTRDRLAS